MKKMTRYNPKEYWEKQLGTHFALRGVGCVSCNETYNKYLYFLKVSSLDKILNKYSIPIKEKSILDIGSGIGFFVDYYNKKGAKKITGMDITEISISMLKEKYPAYNFQVADISDPNLHFKEKFDIVNAFDVIYHITDDDRFEIAINNISSLCIGGGYVLITDVFREREAYVHVHNRSLQKYKKKLTENSIEILDIIPIYYLMGRYFRLPTFVLNKFSPYLYSVDKALQRMKIKTNGRNIKLLIGKKNER